MIKGTGIELNLIFETIQRQNSPTEFVRNVQRDYILNLTQIRMRDKLHYNRVNLTVRNSVALHEKPIGEAGYPKR